MQLQKLPDGVNFILKTLEDSGHEAYAVGGCVRDILRGVIPDDYDITTSALPEDVMSLFGDNAVPTGLKHGTVTVKSSRLKCEVTTYRSEGSYSDHRRPDEVKFVSSIYEDLSRRDFTMNAIALSLRGDLIDPFGGAPDIKNRIIRCVGDAQVRFTEDALRMFRALRFAAVFEFEIDDATLTAIKNCASLTAHLATERITVELQKALMGQNMRPLEQMYSLGLMDAFILKKCVPDFSPIASVHSDQNMRMCAMCSILEEIGVINTENFLRNLRCSSETIKLCTLGVAGAQKQPVSRVQWKKLMSEIGPLAARCSAAALITRGENHFALIDEIEASGECCSISSLAINGNDLKAIGITGQNIGRALKHALEYVIESPEKNKNENLLQYIRGRFSYD